MARVIYTPAPTAQPARPPGTPPAYYRPQVPNLAIVGAAAQRGGQEIAQGGNAMAVAAGQIGEIHSRAVGAQAVLQAGQRINDLLYGDGSPQNPGYFSLSGDAALHARPQVEQEISHVYDDIGSSLNPVARLSFEQESRFQFAGISRQIRLHAMEASRQFAISSHTALASNAARTAGLNYNAPDLINGSYQQGWRATLDTLKAQGIAPGDPRAEAAVARYNSLFSTSLIEGALSRNDPTGAQHLFERWRGFLEPNVAATFESHLHTKLVDAQAMAAVLGSGAADAPLPGGVPGAAGSPGNWEMAHNNPGGLRVPGIHAGPHAGGFQSFASPEAGVAAIRDNLLAYQEQHGLNTIREMVTRWAPPGDNNPTAALIARAAQVVGVGPDQPINLHDPAVMAKMIEATIRNEQGGKNPVSSQTIEEVARSPAGGEVPGLSDKMVLPQFGISAAGALRF